MNSQSNTISFFIKPVTGGDSRGMDSNSIVIILKVLKQKF